MQKIAVVGSINIDLVSRVPRLPREGETLHGHSFTTVPGGKGANQAVAAARLGGQVHMVGRLGEDAFGPQLRQALEQAGVQTSGVLSTEGPSGSAIIMVTDAGANSILVTAGANARLTPEALEGQLNELRDASVVLTQLEVPVAAVERLATYTHQARIPLILDPAPVQALGPQLLEHVTWLTPNESETCALLRQLGRECGDTLAEGDLPAAAECLLAQGVRNVVLKLGARGVYLQGQDIAATRIPGFAVEAVDTTAAGDAFNGGFAYALTTGALAPEPAARFACAVAALSVTRAGAQPSMPSRVETEDFVRRHDAQAHCEQHQQGGEYASLGC